MIRTAICFLNNSHLDSSIQCVDINSGNIPSVVRDLNYYKKFWVLFSKLTQLFVKSSKMQILNHLFRLDSDKLCFPRYLRFWDILESADRQSNRVYFDCKQFSLYIVEVTFLTGGALGLFTGMSLLTIIECFYWLVVIVCKFVSHLMYRRQTQESTLRSHKINIYKVHY